MKIKFESDKYLVLKTEDIKRVGGLFPYLFRDFKGFIREIEYNRSLKGKPPELRGIFINEDTGSLYDDVMSHLERYVSLMESPSVFGKNLADCGTDIYDWLKTDEPRRLFTVEQLSEVISAYKARDEHLKERRS